MKTENCLLPTLPCSTPAMYTTNKWSLQANIRPLLLRSVESWVEIQNIMGYVSVTGHMETRLQDSSKRH